MFVIIPYRNRAEHLRILLTELYKRKYKIIIVEQANEKPFNRGLLLNWGFNYAEKHLQTNSNSLFCFHDVDMIPEINTIYRISENPPVYHLATAASQFKNTMPYNDYIGGVTVFNKDTFLKINGFSNKYFGWGCEDDDLMLRLKQNNISVKHIFDNTFKSLPHSPNGTGDQTIINNNILLQAKQNITKISDEGLSSIKCNLFEVNNILNHWWIKIDF